MLLKPPVCPARPAPPNPGTHMREQREVQVPPQVAHGAPTPVLKHVQVHLPFVLGIGGPYLLHGLPPPSPALPPSPLQAEPAHLLPPWGCLMGEVQWQLPSPCRKQHISILTFGLQERKGSGVRAGRAGRRSHTARQTFTNTPSNMEPHRPKCLRAHSHVNPDPWPRHVHSDPRSLSPKQMPGHPTY